MSTVLIVAPDDDTHSNVVKKRFEQIAPSNTTIVNWDLSTFPQKSQITFHSSHNNHTLHIPNHPPISSNEIQSVWWRRSKLPQIQKEIDNPTQKRHAEAECKHVLEGFWHSLNCFWVNPLTANRTANHKNLQLQIAAQLGFKVPNTIITSIPEEVRSFWEQNQKQVIFKPLTGIPDQPIKTTKLTENDLQHLDSVKIAPVIFQEFIPAAYDLRITVIGQEIFPAQILSQESQSTLDWRCDQGVEIRSYQLPQKIKTKIHQLMSRLGLVYGAIDMRVTPEQEYVFFEINPSGQFLFVEISTNLTLSQHIAELLIESNNNNSKPS